RAEMRAERGTDPLDDRALVRDGVEGGVECLGPLARDLPQQVDLRLDVGVERALLDAERLGEIAHRRAVVALLGEESRGGAGQLCAAGGDSATLTIVRLDED